MASKIYTAQEMRDEAKHLEALVLYGTSSCGDDDRRYRTMTMLYQAADAMECEKKRERKYEYSYRFLDGDVAADHRENPRMVFGDPVHGRVLVRREVGEWEEVTK